MNAAATITHILGQYVVKGKSYPQPLPPALAEWYCYTVDGGHSILCVIKQLYRTDKGIEDFLVPVPVKSVLRGYSVEKVGPSPDDCYVFVDFPYNSLVGLQTPRGDDEF